MKTILTIVSGALLIVGFVWFVEREHARYATNHATTAVYAVQESYLRLRSALNDALNNERAYEAAQVYDDVLRGVFTMMDVYSTDLTLPDIYTKYGDKFRLYDIASPLPLSPKDASEQQLWDKTPLAVFDQMRSTFSQPLDQLVLREPSWHEFQSSNSNVFWVAYFLKEQKDFQKHSDRSLVEKRLKTIRSAFENDPNGLSHIKAIVSRRSEEKLWRPLLGQVASRMVTSPFPGALPDCLSLGGLEKWTAWDVSQPDQFRCLTSFLPWDVQANEPAEGVHYIVVVKRSAEYVGYYVPEGSSSQSDRRSANADAYVESAHVVVGQANPFEVFGVRVLRSEDPPEQKMTSTHGVNGGYYATVGDEELSELFAQIRGKRRDVAGERR